jgi:hypothetical protein
MERSLRMHLPQSAAGAKFRQDKADLSMNAEEKSAGKEETLP